LPCTVTTWTAVPGGTNSPSLTTGRRTPSNSAVPDAAGSSFEHLLTLQAKYGLPLAFITTGQKVPDDIVLPDAHAIASRILSAPLL